MILTIMASLIKYLLKLLMEKMCLFFLKEKLQIRLPSLKKQNLKHENMQTKQFSNFFIRDIKKAQSKGI